MNGVSRVLCVLAVSVLATSADALPQEPAADLGMIPVEVLEKDQRNSGIEFEVRLAPEYGEGAISLAINTVSAAKSKADVMRVVLMALDLVESHTSGVPSMIVFLAGGQERLLMEGAHLGPISTNWNAGKPMPAWRLLIENSVKPDGSSIELSGSLLQRTTQALNSVELLIPQSVLTGSETESESGREDALAEAARESGAELVEGWIYQDNVDPVNERRTLIISRQSEPDGDEAILSFGCVQVTTSKRERKKDPSLGLHRQEMRMLIRWDQYIDSDGFKTLVYRIDDEPPQQMTVPVDKYTNLKTGSEVVSFANSLLAAKRLILRIKPYDDPNETAIFDVSSFSEASADIMETCGQ